MSSKKSASIYTAFRMPTELREEAKRRADEEGRSLSNYIKFLITRDLGLTAREENSEYHTRKKR